MEAVVADPLEKGLSHGQEGDMVFSVSDATVAGDILLLAGDLHEGREPAVEVDFN